MLFRSLPPAPAALARPTRTLHLWLLALLFAAWIVPGLIGHEPWKSDEATTFGLIYHILQSGDWVVPTLAGEPFMAKPPLYYLVAALFAKVFSLVLPLHDGARLASGFFMGLTFLFTALGARELFGKNIGKGWVAALILLGCLGLLVRAHQIIAEMASLSGYAIGLYGLALCLRRSVAGGVWLGVGAGIGFMSEGLFAPGILGITAVALLLFKAWRNRKYLLTLLVALGAVLPWLLIWPLALYLRSPDLFSEWLGISYFWQIPGLIRISPLAEPSYYLKILPWFAWPALPLALWTLWALWIERRTAGNVPDSAQAGGWSQAGIQLPVTAFVVMLLVLMFSADARQVAALPLLLPLSLLAAMGVERLRRGAANAFYWFGVMLSLFCVGVIWFYWGALELDVPARLSQHLDKLQPAYASRFRATVFAIAMIYCIAWIVLLLRLPNSPERPVIIWAAGMALGWGMLMTLLVGWLDTGRSYRGVVASMQQSLPENYRCISSQDLGEPQRAMLHYYGNIMTQRIELVPTQSTGGNQGNKSTACDLFLVQSVAKIPVKLPGSGWKKIWEGRRSGEKIELFRLYRRN